MKKAERELLMRHKLTEMKQFEGELSSRGIRYVGGSDEAGRGPLAGPVIAACCVLPMDFDVPGLDDSKKLTEKRRNEMMKVIHEHALAWGVGKADEKTIDRINILEATKGAMKIAVIEADAMLRKKTGAGIEHVLFDAMHIDDLGIDQTSIVKGDSRSVSIAAASIIAKVTRDAIMTEYAKQYPGYGFEKNKGYGTAAHCEGIDKLGICPIHRRTFLKKYFGEK